MAAHGARELQASTGVSRSTAYRMLRRSRASSPDALTTLPRAIGSGAKRAVLAVEIPDAPAEAS